VGDDEYRVVTEALRKEAPKWWDFGDRAESVRRAVHAATLGSFAFFCGNPALLAVPDLNAEVHQQTYEAFRAYMENLLAGAVAEFPQICQAMTHMADEYDAHEAITQLDLNKVYDAKQWN
jgi:hypothetical protein